MRSLLVAGLVICASAAFAAEPADPAAVKTAITRGLDFVAKDSIAWRNEHKCATCHHSALAVWTFREAQAKGLAVDETLLTELNKQLTEAGDGKFSGARPEGKPKALNTKAVYFSLALAQDPDPASTSNDGTKLLLSTVKSDQTEDGSWSSYPETRPPIFPHSDECATLLETLSLLPAAAAGDAEAVAARDKGIAWLTQHTSDGDPQSTVLRVILWRKLDRPLAESQSWVDLIRSRQNPDGGWSQTSDMASDAWATGQALYALAIAGAKADDAAVMRGQQFLMATQREDGGWPMTSRPIKPGGEGGKNLIPITGGGSAWAVLGLIKSTQ